MKKLSIAIIIIALLGGGAYLIFGNKETGENFKTEKVTRGDIRATVTATGSVNAVTTVLVGTQVSGTIRDIYVDFNSSVKKGQLIAQIDPATFEAQVEQARANLLSAKANLEKAEASLFDAKRSMDRNRELFAKDLIARSELDASETNYETAKAQVSVAKAQVAQTEAALKYAETNLRNTKILAPVDGIVISRNVDVGQTVAASFQTPTLFNIAQDLTKMQIETNVDEADIGRIRMGQRSTFTVDAFQGREFSGQVVQIRKAPLTIQNVVTYTVVLSADNSDQRLLPGMTANVQILVDERSNVLKVPNAALRFRSSSAVTRQKSESSPRLSSGPQRGGSQQGGARLEELTEALGLTKEQQTQLQGIFSQRREQIQALRQKGAPPDDIRAEIQRMRDQTRTTILSVLTPEQRQKYQQLSAAREDNPVTRGRVWTLGKNGTPSPVDVVTGLSDGAFVEIVRGDLQEGQNVIVGASQPARQPLPGGMRGFRF